MAQSAKQDSSGWFSVVLFAAVWQFTLAGFVTRLIRSGGHEPNTKRIRILHTILVLCSLPFLVSLVTTSSSPDSNLLTRIFAFLLGNALMMIPAFFWYGIFWGLLRTKDPTAQKSRAQRSKEVKEAAHATSKREPKTAPVKPVKVAAATMPEKAARRLREIATSYDDPTAVVNYGGKQLDAFFVMENLRVTRNTQSQSVSGPGILLVCRSRVFVAYANERSRQAQPKTLDRPWNQTAGVTPNSFDLYFKDMSSFEFSPVTAEDHLVLSAFWQVFNFAMNGYHELLQNPMESGLGNRLRAVAKYIEEHPKECSNGALDVEAALGEYHPEVVEPAADMFQEPTIGDVLDGYELVKPLGAGGFGNVFLAQSQSNPDEKLAIKLMKLRPKIKVGSTEFFQQAEQFGDEASRALNFSGEAYVTSAINKGMKPWPWISYPFLPGKTVLSRVSTGPLPPAQWWNLAHDLLSGLDLIHSEGLVHKDIKPDNIMMLEDRSMILDLGIASVVGYDDLFGGSWNPMLLSPEQLEDSVKRQLSMSSFTPKSDIFAAGMTLYFALKGHMPWPNTGPAMTNEAKLQVVHTHEVDYRGIPEDMVSLLQSMLQIDPKKRSNARALLFLVAPHIDIDLKIAQIEQARRESLERIVAGEVEPEVSGVFESELKGPFATWKPFEDEVRRIVEDIRPTRFILDFYFADGREFVYVQALSGFGGWVFECMSETFTEAEHSKAQKARFLQLGWEPPTASSPNYQRNEETMPTEQLTNILVTALEQGYGIRPAELATIKVTLHDKGAY